MAQKIGWALTHNLHGRHYYEENAKKRQKGEISCIMDLVLDESQSVKLYKRSLLYIGKERNIVKIS